MDDAMTALRAMLAQHPPTGGSFEERRQRWEKTFRSFCPVPEGTRHDPLRIGHCAAEWVRAAAVEESSGRVILYFHGGGYTAGSVAAYRGLAARLSAAAACPVLAADYRLAPEHPFPAGLEDCVAAYRWLIAAGGVAPRRIVLAGDSAGGNFVIATLLTLRDTGEPLPAAGIGMSAQLDMTLSGESVTTRAARDPMILPELLRRCAAAYIGTADRRNPLASPVFADLTGLPPLLLQVGSEEMLCDDSVRLAAHAKDVGVPVELEEWPDMIHVWHLFSDRLPEGRRALDHIGRFVRGHADNAP